jgi:Mysoin-binding motif of peroxisomes
VNSRLGRADNVKFLEHFRYTIVASQLLSVHSYLGQAVHGQPRDPSLRTPNVPLPVTFTLAGAAVTAVLAFILAWLTHWTRGESDFIAGRGRIAVFLIVMAVFVIVGYAYIRRQWLQYLRKQTLEEITEFVGSAHDFDTAAAGALTLVQEVELVSRGYRM